MAGDLAPARRGALFGIWCADGPDPVRICQGRLRGTKMFASGADTVDQAIVTARTKDGPQLLLLPRGALDGRLFPDEWQVLFSNPTASATC